MQVEPKESENPFRVIVAGGRSFNNYLLLKAKLDILLKHKGDVEIVSGHCRGADLLGEKYAEEFLKNQLAKFPAQWNDLNPPCVIKTRKDGTKYNALAGHNRNLQMAEYADALIVFWDGKSSGSKNMLDTAKRLGMPHRIIKY